MKPEMHLAGGVMELGMGMRGSIVKKMVDSKGEIVPCACRDRGCDGADAGLHGVVDGAGIIVENACKF